MISYITPYVVIVGAAYAEPILSGVKIGVGGSAMVAAGLDPVVVKALEPIGVPVLGGSDKVQCRELETDHAVAVRQRDFVTNGYRLVVDLYARQYYRWPILVRYDARRTKYVNTVSAAKPEFTVSEAMKSKKIVPAIEQAIGDIKVDGLSGIGIESV